MSVILAADHTKVAEVCAILALVVDFIGVIYILQHFHLVWRDECLHFSPVLKFFLKHFEISVSQPTQRFMVQIAPIDVSYVFDNKPIDGKDGYPPSRHSVDVLALEAVVNPLGCGKVYCFTNVESC